MNIRNPFKKKTSEAEIEAIANRASMTSLLQSASTRTHDEADALLESSRLLKGRAAGCERTQSKRRIKSSWLKQRLRQWLGVEALDEGRAEDLKFIATRFKYSGDVTAKYNANWHGSLLVLQANHLDEVANDLSSDDAEDLKNAAHSIRQLAAKFIDKKENINNNEASEVTAA